MTLLQAHTCGRKSDSVAAERFCEVCRAPLTSRHQKRTCSYRCAGSLAPIRPQAGELNGNYRGGRSKTPVVYTQRFKARNPEKVMAHQIVASAIRNGMLVRPKFCESCLLARRLDAHHADYAEPLVVEWLCRKCHRAADRVRAAKESQSGARLSDRTLKPEAPQAEQSLRDSHVSGEPAQFLTQIQIARRLGISVQTWRNWRRWGWAPKPADVPGPRPRWRVSEVESFNRQRVNSPQRRTFFPTAVRRRSA